jgi:hypothetical protein
VIDGVGGTQMTLIIMVGYDLFLLRRKLAMIFYDWPAAQKESNLRFED